MDKISLTRKKLEVFHTYPLCNNILLTLRISLIEPILFVTGYISQNLRIPLKPLGLKAHEFGSAILTNIGTLGIKDGYAPLSPFCNVPVIACLGRISKEAVVVDDEVINNT